MRRLSRIVRDRLGGLIEPHRGRHAADRVRPYVIQRAAVETLPPVPAELDRVVGPWYLRWEKQTAAAATVPAGDGLDDFRAAIADPLQRLLAARPDLGHPPAGDLLTGVAA